MSAQSQNNVLGNLDLPNSFENNAPAFNAEHDQQFNPDLYFGTTETAEGFNHVNFHDIDQGLGTQSHVPLINSELLHGQAQPYLPFNSVLDPGIDQGGNTVLYSSSIAFPGNLPTEFSQAWPDGNSNTSTSHFLTDLGEGPVNAAATFDGAAVANYLSYDIGLLGLGDSVQEGQFTTLLTDGNFQSLNGSDAGFGLDSSLLISVPRSMGIVDQFPTLPMDGGFQSLNDNISGFDLDFGLPMSASLGQGQMAFPNEAATTATAVTGRAFGNGQGNSMLMPQLSMPSMPMAPTAVSDAQQGAVFPSFMGTGNPTTASLSTSISAPMPIPMASTSVHGVRAAAPRIRCTRPGCTKTFQRDADRIRHEHTKHRNNYGQHRCPIVGCPQNRGKGLSRSDKVTEHLWKMHANLGYTKKN
ncbi:Zinc C2H2-like protein [Rutstroemia sp. NJR-2017a WRK4]|nr:Zinc C2H2-like protein [Rutstroemia sp. NJR-2017a WRK4]